MASEQQIDGGNLACACACDVCYCGPNCKCTEALCRCEASSMLNSLKRSPKRPTSASSCCSGDQETQGTSGDLLGASRTVVDIGISGMTCSMCTSAVEHALQSLDGVINVSVSLATHSAHIEYASAMVEKKDFIDLIEAIGYEVIVPEVNLAVVELSIVGMTCSMCSQAIQAAVDAIDGVYEASVSLSTNSARIEYDSSIVLPDTLKDAIEDIGYECSVISEFEEEIPTHDRLELLLQQQKEEVRRKKQSFLWSLGGTLPVLVITMVLPHLQLEAINSFLQRSVRIGNSTFVLEALILFFLSTPIQFGCGWAFYKSTWFGLQQGFLGMDVLVAVGTSASYGYAVWATIVGSIEYHFFETSAVLICFVLLGKYLQSLAVRRTSQALTHLLALQPKNAIRINASSGENIKKDSSWSPMEEAYEEEIVPVQSIRSGDIVKVLKGASIPADGVLLFGEISVDESMITGESVPILKTKGSIVLGGTVCAESGQLAGAGFVYVTGVGSQTALSQIVQLVQQAQSRNQEVPIQNLADQISSIFVPSVVAIATITFMVWYALIQGELVPQSFLPEDESPATFSLLFAISCLVISCPCALGLATPTAVMVGTGVGAKLGILFKGGDTVEFASKVDSVVFDKTGTLTKGKPAITDFKIMMEDEAFWKTISSPNSTTGALQTTKGYLLWLLGSLERNSEHPLASAIVTYAEAFVTKEQAFAQPSNFVALTGRGASGTIHGDTKVAVGNRAFFESQGLEITDQIEENMQRMERQGKTAILAAVNSCICVIIGLADELKADAAVSVRYMKEELGLDIWMVTGDNRRTARAIARTLELPIDRVIAEALPVAKVEKVEKLQNEGRIVAMVGDGVNDSPALAQANVGLSLGTGAEIAAEASDMVLVRGNVADVCTALHLSRVIFRRIQLNFVWSLLYNCLSIPVAAGVLYPVSRTRLPPTVAAIAMALSSISVVTSSLSLRLYKAPEIIAPDRQEILGRRQSSRRRNGESNDLTAPLLQEQESINDTSTEEIV